MNHSIFKIKLGKTIQLPKEALKKIKGGETNQPPVVAILDTQADNG